MYTPAKLTLWTFPLDKRKIAIEIANYREQVYVVHDRRIFSQFFFIFLPHIFIRLLYLSKVPPLHSF